jgi:hypothetical protein
MIGAKGSDMILGRTSRAESLADDRL